MLRHTVTHPDKAPLNLFPVSQYLYYTVLEHFQVPVTASGCFWWFCVLFYLWKQCQIIDDDYHVSWGSSIMGLHTIFSQAIFEGLIHTQTIQSHIDNIPWKVTIPRKKKQRVIKRKKTLPTKSLPTRKFMTLELPKPKQTHKEGDSLSQKVICSTQFAITTHPPHFERMPSH